MLMLPPSLPIHARAIQLGADARRVRPEFYADACAAWRANDAAERAAASWRKRVVWTLCIVGLHAIAQSAIVYMLISEVYK